MEESGVSIINQIAGFIQNGGVFMGVILVVWGFGVAISFERFRKLTKGFDVDGPSFMNEIQRYVLSNDIQGAIRVCSGTTAALPKVLKNGLKRANQGTEQIQNALDATALEIVPKVEMRLGYLQLIANILTLFGLLGTIQGLMNSFSALDSVDPAQKAEFLSKGISTAMNTTFLGLITAISIMVVHAILTSKSDKIVNEIDEFSVKLLDLLGTKDQADK
ncbi:MAG: MotA/TolQ/ExbB proton channel family protein [Halobacteriovoraceae bacterium]|jgi:biopolymer transport protein ExbB|nr:MotA/TolQ/ExbB proton channel family protein [Halobacteriovoraceae bacterium]